MGLFNQLRGFWRIAEAMIELEVRRVWHDRTEMYIRAVQPVLWLVVFGYVVGSLHAIPTPGNVPYMDYITPGVIIQATTSVAIFYGLIMIWERESGILKKLIATPASKWSIVIGRSMAAGVRALFQVLFILPVAWLLGIHFLPNPLYFAAGLAIIFFCGSGFAALSILVASILKTRERFVGIGQVLIFPLFFTSSALYPVRAMPPIIQSLAQINPMTYMVDAVRGLMFTGDLSTLPLSLLAITLFNFALFGLATWQFRQIVE